MRQSLVALLKLAAVLGLMVFVFTTIQWSDAYIERAADGSETLVQGKILGDWDRPSVRFVASQPDGQAPATELLITPGERSDGVTVIVSPGFTTYLVNLDWWFFVAGALCYFVSVVFASTRWWWLLRVNQLTVSWWAAMRFTWIGLFFNNVVPGQTGGDAVKALYIMKHCPGGRMAALVSVLVDRILGLGSLALLAAVVMLFALDREGFASLAIGIWSVLFGVALLSVVAFSRRIRRFVRLDELLNRLPARLSGVLKRMDQAVYFYRGHKLSMLLWMGLGMVNHAISVTSVVLIGEALGVGVRIVDYFVLVPVITIASAFPIGPNGWGVGEALYRYLFGTYGAVHLTEVPRATASFIMGTRGVALSVLFRVHLTLWSILGGVLLLFERDRVTRQEIEQEVAREGAEA